MTSIPFSPEIALPLLGAALEEFEERHGFTGQEMVDELNAIAVQLGGSSNTFERTRLNKIKKRARDARKGITEIEWAVYFEALPEFKSQLRERILTWVGPAAIRCAPQRDEDLERHIVNQTNGRVEIYVPASESQLDVYELACHSILQCLSDEARQKRKPPIQPVIALSGGRTQARLADSMWRLVDQSDYNRRAVTPLLLALNDFNDPRAPTYNASTIISRLAVTLRGTPLAVPRGPEDVRFSLGLNVQQQFLKACNDPLLVVLGVGNAENSFLTKLAEQRGKKREYDSKRIVGDLGGLCVNEQGLVVDVEGLLTGYGQELRQDRLTDWRAKGRVWAVVPQPNKQRIIEAILEEPHINRIYIGKKLARSLFCGSRRR